MIAAEAVQSTGSKIYSEFESRAVEFSNFQNVMLNQEIRESFSSIIPTITIRKFFSRNAHGLVNIVEFIDEDPPNDESKLKLWTKKKETQALLFFLLHPIKFKKCQKHN